VSSHFEHRVVISGVGQSPVGRRLGTDPLALTVDAVLAALEDAGLDRRDVDGISTYPGAPEPSPGFSGGVGVTELQDALRLELQWYAGGIEQTAQLGALVLAGLAVAGGLARHVIVFRTVWESSAQGLAGRASVAMGRPQQDADHPTRVGEIMQWLSPFGVGGAALPWAALSASRHFHAYGTTREQLGWIPVTCRANAIRNPKGVYREPMTLEDYLAARMISAPLGLLDCDVPVDGSTALIVSHIDTAPDLRRPALRLEAVGTALRGRPRREQWEDLSTMGLRDAARMLWARTDLRPGDVDVAELYDGFSIITLNWLEALGFCGRGEGGPYVEGGTRIALDGQLPLNTGGGQLSAGRLHGFGHLHEACVQLRGEGGARQVLGDPEIAVVSNGGPYGGCVLLTRWR
jgi:acetyl-CoA acetyltransferase